MFHGRIVIKKINHLHERALRIVYKDYTSCFEDLLKRDNLITIHHRNIQSLAVELFKVKQSLSNSLFVTYLRSQTDFIRSNASTSQYGLNSMRCFTSKVWHWKSKIQFLLKFSKRKSGSGSQVVVTVRSVSHTYTISVMST